MKRVILFVDDDLNLINGLKRSLRGMIKEWDLFFATSGEEALTILDNNQIDVIISDMRMPGMDGSRLLTLVHDRFPQTVRFILSGHADQEMALRASNVAHQFIAKPCDTSKLVETIQHSLQLRELESNPQLIRIVHSVHKLPSLPAMYTRLLTEVESPEASAKSLAKIISNDITMTAKVLQLVNSAFYGLSSKVSNLQHAVAILGINTLKSLVLGQHIFSQFQGAQSKYLSVDQLWEHSVWVANLARMIARSEGADTRIMDDSQVAGVMHDIGKLLQLDIPGFYPEYTSLLSQGVPALEAESKLLGTTHAELGAYLLGIWGLPDPIVQAVAYHHFPSRQPESAFSALAAVYIANYFLTNEIPAVGVIPATQVSSSIDINYLTTLRLESKLEAWTELYSNYLRVQGGQRGLS